ncbi:MAG TPA: exodeoxyribonuclease VII small subunit [Clostridium sp.]
MAKKESYEDMLSKLQEVLASLDKEELNLEESMKAYEDGVKLVNKLYKTLNVLEGKVSMVNDDKEVEFEGENEGR